LLDLAPVDAKHRYFKNLNEIFDVEALYRFYENHQVILTRINDMLTLINAILTMINAILTLINAIRS